MKRKLFDPGKYINEKIKDKKFRKLYEFEKAQVSLAQKIAEIRQENNLKQSELAERMKVTQQFISQIERGNANNLTIKTLDNLARSLGTGIQIRFLKKSGRNACLKIA